MGEIMKIVVDWQSHFAFPDDIPLSNCAKHLITRYDLRFDTLPLQHPQPSTRLSRAMETPFPLTLHPLPNKPRRHNNQTYPYPTSTSLIAHQTTRLGRNGAAEVKARKPPPPNRPQPSPNLLLHEPPNKKTKTQNPNR